LTSFAFSTLMISFLISTKRCQTCRSRYSGVMGPDYFRQFITPFTLLLIKQAFFDSWEYYPIFHFNCSVRLRMIHR
jgi:hypothetical protein